MTASRITAKLATEVLYTISIKESKIMKQVRHAFTLVEILTVTAMICLIMAVIVVAYNGVYRSWASGNTIAAMNSAQLALEKYKLEVGHFPTGSGKLSDVTGGGDDNMKKLRENLLQNCSPFSYQDGNKVVVFDDFGDKPPKAPQEIYYVHLADSEKRDIFMLMSMGKDGAWGGNDDVVFLPFGLPGKSIKAGSYLCSTNASGTVTGELEPLAQ